MKATILTLALALIFSFSFGQEESNLTEKIRTTEKIKLTNAITPLFIISADEMKLELKSGESQQDFLRQINPNWIESIYVLKGLSALDKYGSSAENGAVEILLKGGYLQKIPEAFRTLFKEH